MHRLFVILGVVSVSGCFLVFDDHGKEPDQCLAIGAPESLPAPQRNPENLSCQSFGGGCDPSCGPCPLADSPSVSWGFCGSSCEGQSETACASDPACRVVKDARCAIDGSCTTDFIGCFPTDQFTDSSIDCLSADAQLCSENNACTAFHRNAPCGGLPECPRDFALCMPEGLAPGRCFDASTCDRAQPSCPNTTMAGVANGCFTGACIPLDLCESRPGI